MGREMQNTVLQKRVWLDCGNLYLVSKAPGHSSNETNIKRGNSLGSYQRTVGVRDRKDPLNQPACHLASLSLQDTS